MAIYLYDESLLIDRFYASQGLPDDTTIDLDDSTQFMYEFIELIVGPKIPDHDLSNSDFRTNGVGVLRDAIVAYTEEELNGMFEFYMEYDSEGHLVDELKEERIIKAKAQDKLGYQLFRIYSITKNHENDNLIVKAQHITYDLADNFVEEMIANNLTKKQVMEKIGSSTVEPHPFNVTSSNTTTISSTKLYRTNPLQMIGGMDGSVLQIWGGQIERDNFNLILHDRRGHDDGVTVTYEKNITGLTAEFDIGNLVTRIFPFVYIEATDDTPERLITVNGKYIDSPLINNYSKIYIEPIDYSHDERIDIQDKTDAQIRQQLTNVASQYFEETGNDKVKATMDVAFMHLWETEEYKHVAPLELVGMGDTVTINHSRLKVDATAIVNYIRYDCIAHVNEEVRLGNVKAGLTDSINKIYSIEKKVDEAQTSANQAIVSANGKNTTYYGPDEPSSAQKGDLWFELVDGQYNRTYRHDGIQWQLIVDMDSQEAKSEAEEARQRANQAIGDVANLTTITETIGLQVIDLEEDVSTQYTQLSEAINLRVQKGDVINQINLDTSGVLISGKKLILDGDTTVTGTFRVGNANITSIDAGKITVGDLVGHSLVGGSVIGGYIEQQSGNRRLEMYNGIIDSFYNGQLAMRFGQYSLNFYNRADDRIGRILPLASAEDPNEKGLGIAVDGDFINIGYERGSYQPILRASFKDHITTISGPYNNLNDGSVLRLFANRRAVSDGRFTSHDQPAIILDQSDTSNDVQIWFGGFGRRSGAETKIIHRTSDSGYRTILSVHQHGIELRDRDLYTGRSTSGDPLFRANAIRRRTSTNDANVRINPDSDSDGLMYRTTSSEKQKVNIEKIPYEHALKVLDLTPSTWYDKNDCETYAEYLSCGDRSLLSEVEHIRRIPGLIAEDVERAGLHEFVEYANDEIVNINSKLWTLLIPITRQHNDDIELLKLENQYLKQKVKILEEKVS